MSVMGGPAPDPNLFYEALRQGFRDGSLYLSHQHRGAEGQPQIPELPPGETAAAVGWRYLAGVGRWDMGTALEAGILSRVDGQWVARIRSTDWRSVCRALGMVGEPGLHRDALEAAGRLRPGVPSWMWGGHDGGRKRCHIVDMSPILDPPPDQYDHPPSSDDIVTRPTLTLLLPLGEEAPPAPAPAASIPGPSSSHRAQPVAEAPAASEPTATAVDEAVSPVAVDAPAGGQDAPATAQPPRMVREAITALLSGARSVDELDAINQGLAEAADTFEPADREFWRSAFDQRLLEVRGAREGRGEAPAPAAAADPLPAAPVPQGKARLIAALGVDGLFVAGPDGQITVSQHGLPPPARNTVAGDLLALAQARGIAQLWIHPSWSAQAGLPRKLAEGEEVGRMPAPLAHPFATAPEWDMKPAGLDRWLHAYRAGGAYDPSPVDLVLPQYDRRSTMWADSPNAATMLRSLIYYEQACGIRYRHSPEATGSALLMNLHAGPRAQALVAPSDLPPPAMEPAAEWDTYWSRPLDDAEAALGYVHSYDVNAAYLAACSSLAVGRGQLEHLGVGHGITLSKRPGYWRAEITWGGPEWLPNPFAPPVQRPTPGPRWYTTPTVTLAAELGAGIQIDEAYLWTESHRPLEPWYKRLRGARADLLSRAGAFADPVAADIALRAVKLTYGPLLGGRVASTKWERGGDPLYRPDWRHGVIATARANQFRTLRKLSREDAPWAIANDCLYVVSAHADPLDACPDAVRLGDNPGSYKVDASGLSLKAVLATIDPATHRSGVAAVRGIQGACAAVAAATPRRR